MTIHLILISDCRHQLQIMEKNVIKIFPLILDNDFSMSKNFHIQSLVVVCQSIFVVVVIIVKNSLSVQLFDITINHFASNES